MPENVKLVSGETLDGEKLQLLIFDKPELGKGGFGVVKKAIKNSDQSQELAVKIIPCSPEKKKSFQKQIEVFKSIPQHPNLVRVLPYKCFSENNCYIFMEYCNNGTLLSQMNQKGNFTQEQIFNIFYQILSGYKVLWQKKILHQDLKPDNILIRNGIYKITDFGFSIFHQGYKFNNSRPGTKGFMPLEKFTQKQLYASAKIDVFALGVIFFMLIAKRYPYGFPLKDDKKHTQMFKTKQIDIPSSITSKMSISMQHFFDLILKMIAKKQNDRINFDQIYQFIDNQDIFIKYRQQSDKSKSKLNNQINQMNQRTDIVINQISNVVVINFNSSKQQQKIHTEFVKGKIQQKIKEQTNLIIVKIDKYLISMRLMVYFFDRLNRRLYIQRLKNQDKIHQNLQQIANQEKVILSLIYLSKKINAQILNQTMTHKSFKTKQWMIYKKTNPEILKLIIKDENYLQQLLEQGLATYRQYKIIQRKVLIDKSKGTLQQFMKEVKKNLLELLRLKNKMISIKNRNSLVTLIYIFSSLNIIDNFQQWIQRGEELQKYFRSIQVQSTDQLLEKIINCFQQIGQQFLIDLTEVNQNQNLENQEKMKLINQQK